MMDRQQRIDIFKETVEIVNSMGYDLPNGEAIDLDLSKNMEDNTFYVNHKIIVDYDKIERQDSEILVINGDCFDIAQSFVNEKYRTAVLNMASYAKPCGGVLHGAGAQEENISRRSDLFRSLYMFHDVGREFGITQRPERYPLDYKFGAIYTPDVTVFRGNEEKKYPLLAKPFKVDIISIAAVKNPQLTKDNKIVPYVETTIKGKIRQMLNLGIMYQREVLVLGAFGCGAYNTPADEMARMFKEVLGEKEFQGAFKKVVFAILNDHNSVRDNNPKGNLQPFMNAFYC